MHDPVPSCFRGGGGRGSPPSSTASGPNLAVSLYETHLGLVALSWSRSALGLSLRLHLFFTDHRHLTFHLRPWLLWKRRGHKRFSLEHDESLLVSWDLSTARFPSSGGPEPSSNFFVAVVLNGDMLLAAGDLPDLSFRRTKARSNTNHSKPTLVSRREHVVFKGESKKYETRVEVGGKERKIAINVDESPAGAAALTVAIDGERLLLVKRIKWKFRGSEIVDAGGGSHVRISWDLHDWLFPVSSSKVIDPPPQPPPPYAGERGCAVFVLRFEDECNFGEKKMQGHFGKNVENSEVDKKWGWGYFGKMENWSGSRSGGGERRRGRKKSLLKTPSSSSSTSSASSTSSSTVMDWNSPEEAQLKSAHGFSLLVYAWKS